VRTIVVLSVIALLGAAATSPAEAQAFDSVVSGVDDTEAQRIFESLMSPYCPGLTVAACRSPGAENIRQEVRRRLAAGESRDTIVASLVAVFGEELLGAPPARRWGLALWIPPALLLIAGGTGLLAWLRRRGVHTVPADVSELTPPNEAERKRIAAALAVFDGER
jgi:cytochrome c-type biogenesis protein CcmH